MARRTFRLIPLLLAPALLAGCATPLGGGYGDPYGRGDGYGDPYGGGYGAPQYPSEGRHAVGSVVDIDPSRGQLLLSADSRHGPPQIEIALTQQTRVAYQGREYDPSAIERGDRLDVELIDDRGRLYAGRIEVLRNVREGGYADPYGGDGASRVLDGSVARVDLGAGILRLSASGYGGAGGDVYFDRATRFEYRGAVVSPEQLEPGDTVRVDARLRGNALYAERVVVIGDGRTR